MTGLRNVVGRDSLESREAFDQVSWLFQWTDVSNVMDSALIRPHQRKKVTLVAYHRDLR